jgi:hypothetical protein
MEVDFVVVDVAEGDGAFSDILTIKMRTSQVQASAAAAMITGTLTLSMPKALAPSMGELNTHPIWTLTEIMMAGILNYTTKVPAGRTVGEIVSLLVQKKAVSINTDYENGRVAALTFVVRVGDNMIPFRMTPNINGVYQKLRSGRTMEQAERVAWRIILRWVEVQMAMVESTQAELGQVFLPYAVRPDGDTVWASFQASNTKQLTAGAE